MARAGARSLLWGGWVRRHPPIHSTLLLRCTAFNTVALGAVRQVSEGGLGDPTSPAHPLMSRVLGGGGLRLVPRSRGNHAAAKAFRAHACAERPAGDQPRRRQHDAVRVQRHKVEEAQQVDAHKRTHARRRVVGGREKTSRTLAGNQPGFRERLLRRQAGGRGSAGLAVARCLRVLARAIQTTLWRGLSRQTL